jgi:F-box/leucine-rich repeat protein 4
VKNVLFFTECYGSNLSISYSAINICNRPTKYPDYGDFAEVFQLRKYGPNNECEYSSVIPNALPFHDFIVVEFDHYVLPQEIVFYETYNPGAVIRIYAYCSGTKKWEILFEEKQLEMVEKKAREFKPKLRPIKEPTK